MREADTLINSGIPAPVNSVNSTKMAPANPSDSDLPDEKRSRSRESMLTQPTQELAAAQEQLMSLLHELEASEQTAQRQQILIETLTEQLESSQARVAQMERECFLTQQRYNEQCHQLVQIENTCRELHIRLTRQQRHTLQFKLALEKCLEVHVPSYEFHSLAPNMPPLFLTKAQPIPPWSAQPESLTNHLESASDSPSSSTHTSTWGKAAAKDLLPRVEGEPLDDMMQHGNKAADDSEELHRLEQDLVSLLETIEEPVTVNSAVVTQLDQPLNQSEHARYSLDSACELISPDQTPEVELSESPQQETSCLTPKSNWPSPVVYPSRPPKGRKSLAAIELPTFTRISDERVALAQFTPHS